MQINYKIILLIFLILNLFIPLGMVPLFDLDEGAFSEATREMLKNGDFITTYLNGELRFDKPILIYWLQALSVTIFGLNEFAFRFPSAVVGAIWVFGLFWFTKRYFDEKKAFLASFFLATSFQVNMISKAAIADSLLNMAIAFSMFFIWLYLDKRKKAYLYSAFAFIAVGVLTKGPVAIMIPLVVTFTYLLIKKELKLFFAMIFDLRGIAIFSIIALPWYILEYIDQGEKFIDGFLLKHNVNRFKGAFEGHTGSLFYYIPVLLVGLMPFTTYFIKFLKQFKNILKDSMSLFLIIWFLFVFIFFSFSGTKLPHYIIYGYTPIFIFMAFYFDRVDFYTIVPILLFFSLLLFFPEIISFAKVKKEYIKEMLEAVPNYFDIWYRLYLILATVSVLVVKFLKIDELKKVIAIGFIFLSIVNFVVFPRYAKIAQQPIKEAALIAKKKNYKVIMQGINTPSFMVYSQMLVQRREPKEGEILFTRKDYLKKIKKYKTIYSKYGIYLVKVIKK